MMGNLKGVSILESSFGDDTSKYSTFLRFLLIIITTIHTTSVMFTKIFIEELILPETTELLHMIVSLLLCGYGVFGVDYQNGILDGLFLLLGFWRLFQHLLICCFQLIRRLVRIWRFFWSACFHFNYNCVAEKERWTDLHCQVWNINILNRVCRELTRLSRSKHTLVKILTIGQLEHP